MASLAVLDCTTAECLRAANLQAATTTLATLRCQHHARKACTDAAASNLVFERFVAADRGLGNQNLHTLCDVQRTSLVHKKVFALLADNIRGMIQTALSLGNTN